MSFSARWSTTRSRTRSAPSCCCSPPRIPSATSTCYINSPGGSVDAGMAIYDTMQYVPCDVATVGMGLAASMGQFLLCAGERGKRYALPHARIMMHQPSGWHRRYRRPTSRSRPSRCSTPRRRCRSSPPQHTGQTVDQIEKRLRPRPVVLRRRGEGLRLRRPRGAQRPPGAYRDHRGLLNSEDLPVNSNVPPDLFDVAGDRARSLASCGAPRRPLHHPGVPRAHQHGRPDPQPVHEAVRGADHLPRRPDRRRVGKRRHGSAADARVDGSRP